MSARFDFSEVSALAEDMARAPRRADRAVGRTMKKSALEIKRGMAKDFSGHRYARGLPASLEFEPLGDNGYEIGELNSAGPYWGIAAILAFGTSNNAPRVDHTAALRRETPTMLEHLANDAGDSVFGARG